MIPNILPIIFGFGVMALLGIELDPGTVMIGCICLGLIVDDTVHFLVSLRRHISAGHDIEVALERSITTTNGQLLPKTESLFKLADGRLYRAKHSGRNRGCWMDYESKAVLS